MFSTEVLSQPPVLFTVFYVQGKKKHISTKRRIPSKECIVPIAVQADASKQMLCDPLILKNQLGVHVEDDTWMLPHQEFAQNL